MTYRNCIKIIENYKNTYEYLIKELDMLNKLDVFLLGNRITQDEYEDLVKLLNSKKKYIKSI